jgi:ribulose 1,5-bisphosphate carboxylase large subunit-like protein
MHLHVLAKVLRLSGGDLHYGAVVGKGFLF